MVHLPDTSVMAFCVWQSLGSRQWQQLFFFQNPEQAL
jgi:hypothetical protein